MMVFAAQAPPPFFFSAPAAMATGMARAEGWRTGGVDGQGRASTCTGLFWCWRRRTGRRVVALAGAWGLRIWNPPTSSFCHDCFRFLGFSSSCSREVKRIQFFLKEERKDSVLLC